MNWERRRAVLAALVSTTLAAAVGPSAATSGCAPALMILSPTAGATVQMPFSVRYRVKCFKLGSPPAGHIELLLSPARGLRISLRPGTTPGVVTVPRDPRLSGKRTLVFQLARADRTLLLSPTAKVKVGPLQIVGSR